MTGPLAGVRIVEMGGIGPTPFAGMMLADNGADVVRIDRPNGNPADHMILTRSRTRVTIDLKSIEGRRKLDAIISEADGLIEGFRPGVMERLGFGPERLLRARPRLVYGRMTGWGQTGPYATAAGHDINYIALSGALHATGRSEAKPVAPPGLIGDLGGGGMLLAFAMAAALLHAEKTGEGQVIDCSMAEGSGVLMTPFYEMLAQGRWQDQRGSNAIDSGAPFYDVYETSDEKFLSIGSLEPQFYEELRVRLGLSGPLFEKQWDQDRWPEMKEQLISIFKTRTREDWCTILEGTDVCFAPVLSLTEAHLHPHAQHRHSFLTADGVIQPSPQPRYSKTSLSAPQECEHVPVNAFSWSERH